MNSRKFLIMAALAVGVLPVALTSCDRGDKGGNGNEGPANGEGTELRLSTGVETPSRAAFTAADTQIPGGENVAVWVDETGGAVQLYGNNVLTADGIGDLDGGVRMFFPENGMSTDIYAIHTDAALGVAYPAAALTHTVRADQRALADYAASDLLYARTTNVAKTSSAIGMTFFHLLTKIQVAVKPGNGLTASDILGITIGGTKPDAVFTLDKSTAPAAIGVTAGGSVSDITTGVDVSDDFSAPRYNDAIIVPQSVAGNTPFITVHLAGGDLTYRLPSTIDFASGKKYIYQVTANLSWIILKSSIEDWTPINPVAGNAIME